MFSIIRVERTQSSRVDRPSAQVPEDEFERDAQAALIRLLARQAAAEHHRVVTRNSADR